MIKKTALCADHGLFQPLAHRLAEDYERVLYFRPWVSSFSSAADFQIGRGYDRVERIEAYEPYFDDKDVTWVFPDLHFADLQKWLRKQGRAVWGAGHGEELELLRGEVKQLMGEIGLPVKKWTTMDGMEELRDYLKDHENVYVKISKFRGICETFCSPSYDLVKPKLDDIEHDLGGLAEVQEFIVEHPVDDAVECYDKETELLTSDGWKNIAEIAIGDSVATLNQVTHQIEYQSPTRTVKRFSEKIFKVKRQKIDLAVTAGHNFYLKLQREAKWGMLCLSDFSKSLYNVKADGIWDGVEESLFKLPSVVINGGRRGDIHSGEKVIPMDDWLYFLGWFLSDGCATRSSYTIIITQSLVHTVKRQKIRDVLDRLPFKWNENGTSFRIFSKQLYEYLYPVSRHGEKRVPAFIKGLSPRQIRLFLNGLFDGDGTTATNGATKIYCLGDDKSLADDVHVLLLHVGANGAVVKKKPQKTCTKIGNREVNRTKFTYDVSEHSSRQYGLLKSDFKEHDYNDNVYCVTVPNGVVYARRNGRALWCGNCGYDGLSIDGAFPKIALCGVEIKDVCYFGKITPYASLPEQVREVNKKLSPVMKQYGYRGFFSTEIRVAKDKKPYLIDLTCRHASPAGESLLEIVENVGEVIEGGANGELVELKRRGKYVAQAMLLSDFAIDNWLPISIPDDIREHVHLYHSCKINSMEYVVPTGADMPQIGSVTACGETPQQAIKLCQQYVKKIEAFGLKDNTDKMADAQKELEKV